jgi:hypothetical protein
VPRKQPIEYGNCAGRRCRSRRSRTRATATGHACCRRPVGVVLIQVWMTEAAIEREDRVRVADRGLRIDHGLLVVAGELDVVGRPGQRDARGDLRPEAGRVRGDLRVAREADREVPRLDRDLGRVLVPDRGGALVVLVGGGVVRDRECAGGRARQAVALEHALGLGHRDLEIAVPLHHALDVDLLAHHDDPADLARRLDDPLAVGLREPFLEVQAGHAGELAVAPRRHHRRSCTSGQQPLGRTITSLTGGGCHPTHRKQSCGGNCYPTPHRPSSSDYRTVARASRRPLFDKL